MIHSAADLIWTVYGAVATVLGKVAATVVHRGGR